MSTRDQILAALAQVAPDADLEHLRDDRDLRDELEIDSMDFLNLLIALRRSTGVEVPESAYPRVRTVAGLAAYLSEHVPPR